jgi:hypothetical protein
MESVPFLVFEILMPLADAAVGRAQALSKRSVNVHSYVV